MHSQTRQGPPTLGLLGNIRYTRAYSKELASVPLARARFHEAADDSKLDHEIAEKAVLCLSELAGNAVRHAHDPRKIRRFLVESTIRPIRRRFTLEVSVWDIDLCHIPPLPDPATAAARLFSMDEDAMSGRGLLFAASLSDGIGIDRGPHGKRVWCRWHL
jgi:anti-sigma regulatory factor (Ser/Thr protein kinase)